LTRERVGGRPAPRAGAPEVLLLEEIAVLESGRTTGELIVEIS